MKTSHDEGGELQSKNLLRRANSTLLVDYISKLNDNYYMANTIVLFTTQGVECPAPRSLTIFERALYSKKDIARERI
jgi:hypothetical protein